MSDLCGKARRLRSAEITIDVESRTAIEAKKAPKQPARKRARNDDLPPAANGIALDDEAKKKLHKWFFAIREETRCHGCMNDPRKITRPQQEIFCHIDNDNNHQPLSNEMIGKWPLTIQMKGEADQFVPPPDIFSSDTSTDALMSASLELDTPEPEVESEQHTTRQPIFSGPFEPQVHSPDLPDTSDLIDYIKEKSAESLLVAYPPIQDGLAALDAAMPDHQFHTYAEPLKAAGYRYIHQVARSTPEQLTKDTGMFIPISREVHEYSVAVSELVRMEQVQMPTGKGKSVGKN
ncbi:hypothetical protein FRC07_001533 [Ceratobasidium sp. 392]|nr:hypothetical protein FRC07_001533 [Ceratobasidium sp. 392]